MDESWMIQACANHPDVNVQIALNIQRHWDVKVHVALNIPRQRDVKMNDLAKQILMLLPLLLLLLLLLYVLYDVLIRGHEAPHYNYVVSTYCRSKKQTWGLSFAARRSPWSA